MDSEQREELERVKSRIGEAILDFCKRRMDAGRTEFHADELRQAVESVCGKGAPGSADRILRQLRLEKRLNYVVLSRRGSLYGFVPVVVTSQQLEQQSLF